MTRTLVDMTPDERADCVGMWAERKRRLVVITDVSESVRTVDWCCPATGSSGWDGWVELTPRFDLPRAWTPDGEPFLAGAAAIDTLRQVREALDRVAQECGRYPTPAPGQRHSPYNAGYLDGMDTAHTWVNEALGDTK